MNTGKEKPVRTGHGKEETTTIRVECYAGHRAEESPRRFFLGQREIRVSEIIDRWLDPDHRYFKVRGKSKNIYMLRHDTRTGVWEIKPLSGNRETG